VATPYVSSLLAMHVPAAAHIMNAVVLTAVLSALNSGLYASSRMLFALTRRGDAPQGLASLTRRGVPNSYGTVAVFVYLLIAVSQLKLRKRFERDSPERLQVRMWGYPYLTYLAIAGMLAILIAMAFIEEQRKPLLFGFASLGILLLGYLARLKFGAQLQPNRPVM
jgi:GABA permease